MKFKIPGKLMLAGEWAALEQRPSFVLAINRFVEVEILEASCFTINTPYLDEVEFVYEKDKLRFRKVLTGELKNKLSFAKKTIKIFLKFMEENANPITPFKLTTKSHDTIIKIDDKEVKVGFGSSAAVCVGIGTAIMKFYDYDINDKKIKDIIFKLSCIAHFSAQDFNGSCYDVAASVYGGVLYYKTFNSFWLKNEIQTGKTLLEILEGDWPGLVIKEIKIPENIKILCCYTGKEANSRELIKKMDTFKDKKYDDYIKIIDEIEVDVDSILDAFESGNEREIKMMLHKNQSDFVELDGLSKIGLLTPELRKIVEIANDNDCVGKISGAGGGDCAVAFCFNDENCDKLIKSWEKEGLYPINVEISLDGVREANS